MKAIVGRRYGNPSEVAQFCDVERPEPGESEVLIRVHASSVNPADWLTMVGRPVVARLEFGLLRHKRPIPGKDVAGTVTAVGSKVTRFRPGDEVYGELAGGAYGEYVIATADVLAAKPANLGFAEAAAVPLAGITALQGIRDRGRVRAGQRVLVNGASGGVGTFAVQIARSLGAQVTGVCSTRNLELVRSLGAVEVVDYTREDFTRADQRYDMIFDLVGSHSPSAYRRVMHRDGIYVCATGMPGGSVLGPLPYILRALATSLRGGPKATVLVAKSSADDLAALTELIESGQVEPVIDRVYPLSEAAQALARQGAGHSRGKTIITV